MILPRFVLGGPSAKKFILLGICGMRIFLSIFFLNVSLSRAFLICDQPTSNSLSLALPFSMALIVITKGYIFFVLFFSIISLD